jgi:hypothetical protein
MALAGGTLFVAGPPDVFDEEQAAASFGDAQMQARLAEQDAAVAGGRGSLLLAVSVADGKTLARWELDAAPAFDGMAIAGGRLYLVTADGAVLCFRGGGKAPKGRP